MSEFIFIIPEGWIQVSSDIVSQIGSNLDGWIAVNDFNQITEVLKSYNAIPQEFNVYEARLFNGEVLAVRAS